MSENGTPRINYGFGGNIKWKGITVDVHFQGVGKYDRFVGGVDGGFYQHGGAVRPYFPIWTSDKVYDPDLNPNGVYPRIVGNVGMNQVQEIQVTGCVMGHTCV